MPADLRQLEDRLRAAYADVAATVRPDDISERAPAAASPVRWRAAAGTGSRRATALAAAAAVLLIVITAAVIPQVLQSGSRHRSGGPGAVGHVPHSHLAYVVSQRDLLIPVNLASGTPLKPIPLGVKGGETAVAISPDGTLVYVLTARGQLVPVDLAAGRADPPINVGGTPQGLVVTPDGKAAYVLEQYHGVVAVDLATRTALGLIKIRNAWAFALTLSGKTLYVEGTTNTGPALTAISTATNTTIATIALRPAAELRHSIPLSVAMAPDGRTVYATFRKDNVRTGQSVTAIVGVNVSSNTEVQHIDAGPVRNFFPIAPPTLTTSPDSQAGYVPGATSVIPADLRTGAVLPSIPLPTSRLGYYLTLSPDGTRLYATAADGSTVIPIDTATRTALQPIHLGARRWDAWGGVFAPGGKTLYVLSSYGHPKGALIAGRMTPIDTATGAVGKPIDFPAGLDDIVFSR